MFSTATASSKQRNSQVCAKHKCCRSPSPPWDSCCEFVSKKSHPKDSTRQDFRPLSFSADSSTRLPSRIIQSASAPSRILEYHSCPKWQRGFTYSPLIQFPITASRTPVLPLSITVRALFQPFAKGQYATKLSCQSANAQKSVCPLPHCPRA